MACTYPMIAYEILGEKTKKGKAVITFEKPKGKLYKEIEIPCRQCLMCRIEKAKEWQKRIIAESKMHKENYFVTLTYDDEHITTKETVEIKIDMNTGEVLDRNISEKPTLVKKDVTDFKKRVLEHFRSEKNHTGIRFYYCGEYGPETDRPHYHMIFFNLPLDDLQFWKTNKLGQPMFKSKLLEEKWGMGFVTIGSLTYESAGYVARYVLKKQGNKIFEGKEKEFTEMSRKPGIGKPYYEKYKDNLYKYDSMLIPKEFSESFYTKPPKYFDEIFFEENQEKYEDIKIKRRRKAQNQRTVEEYDKTTSYNRQERKEVKERETARKMVNLKREL